MQIFSFNKIQIAPYKGGDNHVGSEIKSFIQHIVVNSNTFTGSLVKK